MENKEGVESNIERWHIIDVGVERIPEEWKNVIALCRLYKVANYTSREVFEINRKEYPEEYAEYPALYRLLKYQKNNTSKDKILILREKITPEKQEQVRKVLKRVSKLICILFDGIKEYKWGEGAIALVKEYEKELISTFTNIYPWIISNYLEFVKSYREWEITDQDIEKWKLEVKEMASSDIEIKRDMIYYLQWTEWEIEKEKNKFLENWMNIFRIE